MNYTNVQTRIFIPYWLAHICHVMQYLYITDDHHFSMQIKKKFPLKSTLFLRKLITQWRACLLDPDHFFKWYFVENLWFSQFISQLVKKLIFSSFSFHCNCQIGSKSQDTCAQINVFIVRCYLHATCMAFLQSQSAQTELMHTCKWHHVIAGMFWYPSWESQSIFLSKVWTTRQKIVGTVLNNFKRFCCSVLTTYFSLLSCYGMNLINFENISWSASTWLLAVHWIE